MDPREAQKIHDQLSNLLSEWQEVLASRHPNALLGQPYILATGDCTMFLKVEPLVLGEGVRLVPTRTTRPDVLGFPLGASCLDAVTAHRMAQVYPDVYRPIHVANFGPKFSADL